MFFYTRVYFWLLIGLYSGANSLRPNNLLQLSKGPVRCGRPLLRRSMVDHSYILDSASLSLSLLRETSKGEAQGAFWFFFLAGSGALGIGFAQVPKILKEYAEIAALQGKGESKGGEALDLNPIAGFGYPDKIAKADLEYIIRNLPTVDQVQSKGKKLTYMEQQGYLSRQGFVDSFPPSTNQLSLYVVYDALTGGGSSNSVAPSKYLELSRKWSNELGGGGGSGTMSEFVGDLTKTQVAKISAYAGLAFLIYLVLDLIVESGISAFG